MFKSLFDQIYKKDCLTPTFFITLSIVKRVVLKNHLSRNVGERVTAALNSSCIDQADFDPAA